jgi:soluble cytochrome b562
MGMDEDELNKVTFNQMRRAIAEAKKAIAELESQEPVEPTEKIYKAWDILVGQHKDLLEENKKLRNQSQRTEQTSAERTLQILGYINNGGEYWKPPLGKQPPPQRTWVGLTNGEMIELSEMELGGWDLILEVETKLKEKNA